MKMVMMNKAGLVFAVLLSAGVATVAHADERLEVLPLAIEARAFDDAWTVRRDVDLREQLDAWSQRAGWSLVWDSEYSYVMQANAVFTGDFVSAVTQLFSALGSVNPALYPEVFQGNQVLVVKGQPRR